MTDTAKPIAEQFNELLERANMIDEYQSVYNCTGLTPRQLLKQRNKLLDEVHQWNVFKGWMGFTVDASHEQVMDKVSEWFQQMSDFGEALVELVCYLKEASVIDLNDSAYTNALAVLAKCGKVGE